jgi:acyl carrier protein
MQEIEDLFELAPAQQGMLYQALSSPESGLYIEQVALDLRGPLDMARLAAAWRAVVARTAMLRASFHLQNLDRPVLVVHRHVDVDVVDIARENGDGEDWRALTPDELRSRREEWLRADRERPFDLSRAPLSRIGILSLDDSWHTLVWTYHHLLFDGWSMAMVLQDLFDHYAAPNGRPARPLARVPFREFVLWRQQRDDSDAEQFWRGYLEGFDTPTLIAAPRAPSLGYATEIVRFGEAASERLAAFAARVAVSIGTVLQAAWAARVARQTGRRDVVFGITVAGRPPELPHAEQIVGMLINTVPLRIVLDPSRRVSAWLDDLQTQHDARRPFEHVSPVQIQQWTRVPPSTPLFDSLFVYENYPMPGWPADAPLTVRGFEFSGARTHYPLVLVALPGSPVEIRAIYQPSRIDASEIGDLLRGIEPIVEMLVAHASDPLSEVIALPVDVSAPSPAEAQVAGDEAPRTDTERALAQIWADVLGLTYVGRRDDFFDLGGHSLLAMQLLSRVRERFQIELTIIDLFTMTLTIEELAVLVDRGQTQPA